MTKCPWFGHPTDPDPAGLGLGVGEMGICLNCHLKYVVVQATPSYVLAQDAAGSAPTILALARAGRDPDSHRALLASPAVAKALSALGVTEKHHGSKR